MQKEAIFTGIIGLLAGSLLTVLAASNAVNTDNVGMMRMMGMRMMEEEEEEETPMHHMEEMMEPIIGKEGDAFDREFLSLMIVHHQGAIDMAKDAKEKAKRDEIKKLSDEIITAQTQEIEQMRQWQKAWGYE